MTVEKLLMKPSEVAEALNIGKTTTHQLIARGDLQAVRIGRALRVSVDEVERFARGEQAAPMARARWGKGEKVADDAA